MCENNGNPIRFRTCIRLEGKLAAPLLAGSGEQTYSDNDTLTDYSGKPFVSGSALAGAFRHQLEKRYLEQSEVIHALFGKSERQSSLHIYAMELSGANLSIRDGVKLDSFKTAVAQAKFDAQVVDRGANWTMRLEWIIRENDQEVEKTEALLCQLMDDLFEGMVTIGARTTRGYGKIIAEKAAIAHFNYQWKEDAESWLDWSWDGQFEEVNWGVGKSAFFKERQHIVLKKHENCLRVPLLLANTMMIRNYKKFGEKKDTEDFKLESQPDYEHMKAADVPIIPGTAWAGAIRSRIYSILLTQFSLEQQQAKSLIEKLFGTWLDAGQPKSVLQASRVRFEEAVITGGKCLSVTRNAIDRFTSGVIDGALYTGEPWVEGETELVIRWSNEGELSTNAILGMLLWAVEDIKAGFLAIGGETSVGRGIFEEKPGKSITLNGMVLTDEKLYYQEAAEVIKEWLHCNRSK